MASNPAPSRTKPRVQPDEVATPVSAIADPGPLGLAAFALTTFLLSAKNAGLTDGTNAWLGYALVYGGLCQLLAGMWEFRARNVFGATAFASYGSFWIGLGLYNRLVATQATPAQIDNDLGWILVGFAIFTAYMLLASTQTNRALCLAFLGVEVTLLLLAVGHFSATVSLVHAGGYVGVATAAVAWYVSAAGVVNGMAGRSVIPLGAALPIRWLRASA